jgi:O-antigen/teichoic acid export membrane protein
MLDKKKIFIASFWVILIFGLSQLVRLGSNLIITRLLVPEMFGVMAVVNVVIFGIAMFTDLGLWAFIVRHKNPEASHLLDVVWTLQVIRGWLMFVVVLILAAILSLGNQYFPHYFSGIYTDSRLPLLIIIAGVGSLIGGYKSLASPMMSRKLEVGKLEMMELLSQIAGITLMIIWVWLRPTIWALVASGLIAAFTNTLLSYYLFPYRHKFLLDKTIVKEVFHFSKWIVIASVLTYLFSQGDKLFFAGKIEAAELGIYSIAFMLVATLTSVTQTLAEKIIFPVFSSLAHGEKSILKQRYYQVRQYLDAPIFFVTGLLIALGPLIVETLYDSRYASAGWMFQILIFSVIGNTLSLVSMECLSALSVTKVRMWVMLIRTLGLFIGLPLFFNLYGLYGAIWVVALNVWLSLPVIYWTLAKNSVFSFFKEVRMLPMIGMGYLLGSALLKFKYFLS